MFFLVPLCWLGSDEWWWRMMKMADGGKKSRNFGFEIPSWQGIKTTHAYIFTWPSCLPSRLLMGSSRAGRNWYIKSFRNYTKVDFGAIDAHARGWPFTCPPCILFLSLAGRLKLKIWMLPLLCTHRIMPEDWSSCITVLFVGALSNILQDELPMVIL
jgi:hypothetical protein